MSHARGGKSNPGMHAMNSYLSLNALQLHRSRLGRERGQQLLGARDREHLIGEVDLVGVRQRLHAGSKIDSLAKVVQSTVQRHGEARAYMDTDFQADQVVAGLGIETGDLRVHVQRSSQRIERVVKARK
jgi:hypothetical protein